MPDKNDMDQKKSEHKSPLETVAKRKNPKRFYKDVTVSEVAGGFSVLLDGRQIKTPRKLAFQVPSKRLAEAVCAEWHAQEEEINPDLMPLTRFSNTSIDRVEGDIPRIIDEMCSFANSDLLCYRADHPVSLVERQSASWDSALDQIHDNYGARFFAISGIIHQEQKPEALNAIRKSLEKRHPFELTGVYNAMTLTGSIFLSLLLADKIKTPDETWQAAHIDEDWNIERWGEDEEACAHRERRRREFDGIVHFLSLVH